MCGCARFFSVWQSNPQRNDVSTLDDSGPYNETRIIVQPKPCPWICELTNDAGYVVYSALGSFYIPTLVMLFFYWRIYNAAVSTTKAINQGFRTTKGSKMLGSRYLWSILPYIYIFTFTARCVFIWTNKMKITTKQLTKITKSKTVLGIYFFKLVINSTKGSTLGFYFTTRIHD